jgi:membrane protein DedA with SNARE-associated domain
VDLDQTFTDRRRLLIGLAVVRAAMAGGALLAAPWLYREHAAVLVLLRPTKEVFLFAGFLVREGDVALPVVVVAALPLLLAGVWLFFALGRAFADDLERADLPGLAGRLLPKRRVDRLRKVLDERGMRVVFLGRLAAFPSSLMAATAGAAGVAWKDFLIADTAGALVSLGMVLGVGYGLGEAYDEGGAWVTGFGVLALVGLAILLGRALTSGGSSRRS